MVELTRFQNLRPAQWMSGEEVQHAGLALYPDSDLSPLAKALATVADSAAYSSHIARFREQQNKDIVTSIDSAHSVIRTFYDWLNFKARPIKLKDDLEDVVASLTDLDLEKEWRRYADNLLLAIEGNHLSKTYCADFQLIIRIFHLVRRALKKTDGGYRLNPDTSEELVEQILGRSIILPPGVIFGRCRMSCSERNAMQLPVPDRQLDGRPTCECKCDESCKKPANHCVCIRPYIGDLFLIREKLARYEAGEIADIENILAGEEKIRRHRMLNRSEETIEVEAETLSSTERDHAVTEKFNLRSEVKNTVDQKSHFQNCSGVRDFR